MKIHQDFSDFIAVLNSNHVKYVIVGAFALANLGFPRYTGDLDIWIKPTPSNAQAMIQALANFGLKSPAITEQDILSGSVIQLGYPPVRIDLLTILDGLTTDEIWASRQKGTFGKHDIHFLGKEAFLKNKRAIGRHKDIADIETLSE